MSNIGVHDIWNIMYMVRKLEPNFVKPRAIIFIQRPSEPKKDIELVLYWFEHGVSANIIANKFNVGALTIHKMLILLLMP